MQDSHAELPTKKQKRDHARFTNEENKGSARKDDPSKGRHITDTCQIHAMCETKMNLVLSWAIGLLEQPLDAGLHALIMVRYILPCRLLDRATKTKIDKIYMLILVQQTMLDHRGRTVVYHNRSLQLPDRCVKIVEAMRRFKRSYIPRGAAPRYLMASHYSQNKLEWISEDLLQVIHQEWSLVMERVTPFRITIPQERYAEQVAKALTRRAFRDRIIQNHTTVAGRPTSEPRIRKRKASRQRRSKSLPTA